MASEKYSPVTIDLRSLLLLKLKTEFIIYNILYVKINLHYVRNISTYDNLAVSYTILSQQNATFHNKCRKIDLFFSNLKHEMYRRVWGQYSLPPCLSRIYNVYYSWFNCLLISYLSVSSFIRVHHKLHHYSMLL